MPAIRLMQTSKSTTSASEKLTAENVADELKGYDGIIVPGGFGNRGLEGMIQAIRYARENNVPFLGICLGMQWHASNSPATFADLKIATVLKLMQTARTISSI